MKSRIMQNLTDLVKIFYPIIIDWAQVYDYSIPSITVLGIPRIDLLDCADFDSTYGGKPVKALGTFKTNDNVIQVAFNRNPTDVMSTLLHELGHAVQKFNLGTAFGTHYSHESAKTHNDNAFENEVRHLQKMFHEKRTTDIHYRAQTNHFQFFANWYTKKVKPIVVPVPVPKPVPKARSFTNFDIQGFKTEMEHSFSYREDYNNPRFRHYRKQWWLN